METTTARSLRSPLGGAATAAVLALLMGASERDLSQCAAVDDPTARLACYDALAGRATAPGTAGPAVPAPVAAPPAMPDWERKELDNFGKPEGQTNSLAARIVGTFNEWQRGTLIRLDNGQIWRCVDDKAAVYPDMPENPEVVITRGMLGYSMEVKAVARRIRVKRVE